MHSPRSRKPAAIAASPHMYRLTGRRAAVLLLGAVALAAAAAIAAVPAYGQAATDSQVFACTSQQDLEQTIQSDGSIVPDGCRSLSVSSLSSEGQELCLLNFDAGEEDILGQLQEAALPSEWWVACDALAAAIAD